MGRQKIRLNEIIIRHQLKGINVGDAVGGQQPLCRLASLQICGLGSSYDVLLDISFNATLRIRGRPPKTSTKHEVRVQKKHLTTSLLDQDTQTSRPKGCACTENVQRRGNSVRDAHRKTREV